MTTIAIRFLHSSIFYGDVKDKRIIFRSSFRLVIQYMYVHATKL